MDRFDFNADNPDACAYREYGRRRKLYYGNAMPDGRALVFLAGLCLGMVFFYLAGIGLVNEESMPSVFSRENIARLADLDFYEAGLFEYVLGKRIVLLVFLLICTTSFLKTAIFYAAIGWGGFELGVVMFTLVYAYGLKGFLFGVSLLLPHGVFYLAAFLLIFNKRWMIDKTDYHNKLTKLKRILIIPGLWLLGMLSEIWLNPELVKVMAVFFK